ncbi:hypothetical protein [Maribacter sp. HTCC2170]|uniref:hypothetical protein n=1 Tax=Maribacter sp. (strain HTCC2170 / KCCM 42371) TaxID=313603 RepID=UPI00006AFD40|nr:hypothetical protein [Maribacter sp. HTCC2170]EAR01251.1 hypothetical protein FB2170_11041 [Maribacter sp. HTCC2170]
MKTELNFKRPFLNLFIAILFLTSPELIGQEKISVDLKDFKVIVEKTDNGIRMKGVEGSAWSDLSFSLNAYQSQAVDEYGMAKLDDVSLDKDNNLADFLFTITKTENGLELKGIEGTAWTELSFALAENKKQAINQLGMTSMN